MPWDFGTNILAPPARDDEATIDDRGSKEPLRGQDPGHGDDGVAEEGLDGASGAQGRSGVGVRGLGEEQGEEGEGGPEPADFHKVDVEDVVLAGEVVDGAAGGAVVGVGVGMEVDIRGDGRC